MAISGLQISDVRATLDERALLDRQLRVRVESATVSLGEEAIRQLLAQVGPVKLERIHDGRIVVRGKLFDLVEGTGELRPRVAPGGEVQVTLSVKAGFLPIPAFVIQNVLQRLIAGKPGLRLLEGGVVSVNLAELAPAGVELPRVRSVRAQAGALELTFGTVIAECGL